MTEKEKNQEILTPSERLMRKIIAVIFIVVLFGLSLGTIGNFVNIYREYVGEFHGMKNVIQALTFRSDNGSSSAKSEPVSVQTSSDLPKAPQVSLIQRFQKKCQPKIRLIKKITYNIEDMYTRYFCYLDKFVDGHGLANKLLGKKVIYASPQDGYYCTQEKYLFPIYKTPIINEGDDFTQSDEIIEGVEHLDELNQYLKERDKDFLYILPAIKNYEYLDAVFHHKDINNLRSVQSEQWFVNELKSREIPYICAREMLVHNEFDVNHWFYRTDHHWRYEAAYQLFPTVLEYLGIISEQEAQNLKIEDYFKSITVPSFFVGSTGRQVGRFFCKPDDFTYYLPKETIYFKSKFIHRVTHKVIVKDKSVPSDKISEKTMNPKDHYANRYSVTGGVDTPETWIYNENAPNNLKIVLVKTSHATPIISYLKCFVRELILLDFRYLTESEGNLRQIIEKEDPDKVIIVYPEDGLNQVRF